MRHSLVYPLLVCFFSTSRAADVTLDVVEDSWIHGLTSSTHHGSDTRLSICPTADYWIYLKFDLGDVAGHVETAELRMTRFDGSRPEEISLYFVGDDSWTEANLIGPTRPEPRSPAPAAALGTGVAAKDHDRWTSAALANVVRQEAAGDGIVTLMLREDPNGQLDVRRYYSREGAPDATLRPSLLLSVADESVADGWRVADVGFGTKPSFDFDAAGRLHVMGMTETGTGVVWHAAAASVDGPWSPRIVSSGYFYGPGDLVVDAGGTAHLAWHNHDDQDPNHLTVDPAGETMLYRIPSPGHNGWDNSLAFDAGGVLHQASVNPSGFGAINSLEHGVFDGSAWTYETVPMSGSFMYGLNTAIALDRDGRPHIVYCEADDWTSPGALRYAFLTAGGWQVTTITAAGIAGRFPVLALDHWDRPHAAWVDVDADDFSRGTVRYAVFNNDAWEFETIDVLEDMVLSFGGARKLVSLVLDSGWRPHVAYGDRGVVRYATKPFADWQVTTVLEDDRNRYNGLVVLRLDGADLPAIVFWEEHAEEAGLVRLVVRLEDGHQLPGDCDQSGDLSLTDALCLVGYWFSRDREPLPCGSGSGGWPGNRTLLDANGDGRLDISDAARILLHLFRGAPPPALGADCVAVRGCHDNCKP